jgi:hypothetical protein
MEPGGTLACISLRVDISPSTKILNFLSETKLLISFIRLTENFNFDHLYTKPKCHVVRKASSLFKNSAT